MTKLNESAKDSSHSSCTKLQAKPTFFEKGKFKKLEVTLFFFVVAKNP